MRATLRRSYYEVVWLSMTCLHPAGDAPAVVYHREGGAVPFSPK